MPVSPVAQPLHVARMAEPFGILSGAVSIAAAFTACVDCFEYVKLGRRFGRDFQTSQLSLTCARLRLSRWGVAVRVYDDPQLGCRTAGGVKPPLSWHMTTPPVYLGGRAQGEREPSSIKNINSLLDALKVVIFCAAPFPRFSAQWFAQWFNN
jgi:hypothetical protein